jgi:hypothetical protein
MAPDGPWKVATANDSDYLPLPGFIDSSVVRLFPTG